MKEEKLTGISSVVQEQRGDFLAKVKEARSKDGFEQTAFSNDDLNDYSWLYVRRATF